MCSFYHGYLFPFNEIPQVVVLCCWVFCGNTPKKKRHLQYFTENFPISPQHDDIDLTKRADRNGKSLKMSSHRSLVKSGFYHDPMSQNPKFTERDWSFNNQLKSRLSCDQQKLADRVICEASRVIDETKETTVKFKKETDFRLGERVTQISFTVEELREQKKLGEQEQEILKVLCALFFGKINFLTCHYFRIRKIE